MAFSKLSVASGCLAIVAAMLIGIIITDESGFVFSAFFGSLIVFAAAMGVIAYRGSRNKGTTEDVSGIKWKTAESIWIATFFLAMITSAPIHQAICPFDWNIGLLRPWFG